MTKRVIKKHNTKENISNLKSNEITNFFKILVIVIVTLVIIYFILAIFVTKDINLFNKKDESVLSQSNNILITETFSMKNNSYYVFLYDKEKEDYKEIKELLDSKTDVKIYNVDLSNSINKSKVSDIGNRSAQKYNDLKINGTTLIKIENSKNILYLEGKNEIINNFN